MSRSETINICVATGTRADYGLLRPVMRAIERESLLRLQVIAAGMHLAPEFGLTWREIEADGFRIDRKVEMLLSSDSPVGTSKSMGMGMISFAEAFRELSPDVLVVLGDRFEIFSAAAAATVTRLPIAHIHGGEVTRGAYDDSFRHAITKMAHLHFTSTETYRKRVIQLGEQPERVFHTGAPGLDTIGEMELMDRNLFEEAAEFPLGKRNLLVTYHPATRGGEDAEEAFGELLAALDTLEDTHLLFTLPNADTGGRVIIDLIGEYVEEHPKTARARPSLGSRRYLSALKHMDAVVGNSSSALIEAPAFETPAVNIGDRQAGRVRAKNVIDCKPERDKIQHALEKAMSDDFRRSLEGMENPYGSGGASGRIVRILRETNPGLLSQKDFFDIDF